MLPLGHTLVISTQTITGKPYQSAWKLYAFALLGHAVLDAVPHIEPGVWGPVLSLHNPSPLSFLWVGAELVLSFVGILALAWMFTADTRLLLKVTGAALLPDALNFYLIAVVGPNPLSDWHSSLHWWKSALSSHEQFWWGATSYLFVMATCVGRLWWFIKHQERRADYRRSARSFKHNYDPESI